MTSRFNGKSRAMNRRQLLLGSAGVAFVGLPALAQISKRLPSASPASKASHSSLRLIGQGKIMQSGAMQSGTFLAGIAIEMAPGFKTYWRHPGDSGVPPTFQFTGSSNLASAEVLYPAPQKFADGAGGHSFGYATPEVVFPIIIKAADPTKPVELRLKADYAVCEKICIPASGEASLVLSDALDDREASRLAAALSTVPERIKLGEGKALKIVSVKKAENPETFLVDVRLPQGMNAELFLEGESPWFFETKAFTRLDAERGSYLVHVIERSKAADCTGADLTLTLVNEKNSIEVATRLDLAMVTH